MKRNATQTIRSCCLLLALAAPTSALAQFYEKVISFTETLQAGPPIRENLGIQPHYLIEGAVAVPLR